MNTQLNDCLSINDDRGKNRPTIEYYKNSMHLCLANLHIMKDTFRLCVFIKSKIKYRIIQQRYTTMTTVAFIYSKYSYN